MIWKASWLPKKKKRAFRDVVGKGMVFLGIPRVKSLPSLLLGGIELIYDRDSTQTPRFFKESTADPCQTTMTLFR